MKIAAFTYTYPPHKQANIGDCVQTLAVEQHLPRVDFHIDRDSMNTYDGDECVVVMNGWFSHRPTAWPPSKKIHPVFHGFHMSGTAAKVYKDHVDYFKRHGPIGCRDRATFEMLKGWGVEAYISFCTTLTFPRRKEAPHDRYVVLADAKKSFLPGDFRSKSVQSSHNIAPVEPLAQMDYARSVLDFYRSKATHVITSRIHAAMPCVAMGIPTLYIGRINNRTEILKDIGIPEKFLWKKDSISSLLRKSRIGDDDFYRGDIENLKADIIGNLRDRLKEKGVSLKA